MHSTAKHPTFFLCAISVFSVPLWLTNTASLPQRHREHRDRTEKNQTDFKVPSNQVPKRQTESAERVFPGSRIMFTTNVLLILLCLSVFSALEPRIEFEHIANRAADSNFKFKDLPSPSKDDAATNAKLTLIDGVLDGGSGELSALTDGLLPVKADDPGGNLYFNAGSMGGRFLMDFETPIDIAQVISYSWHPGARGPQLYKLYAADGSESPLNLHPMRGIDPGTQGWKFIATVSTIPKQGEDGGQYAARVSDPSGSLGKFRYLLFDCYVTELNDEWGNTFYSEIDVITK